MEQETTKEPTYFYRVKWSEVFSDEESIVHQFTTEFKGTFLLAQREKAFNYFKQLKEQKGNILLNVVLELITYYDEEHKSCLSIAGILNNAQQEIDLIAERKILNNMYK